MQTKLGSFLEAWANVAIGFLIAWAANLVVLPMFGLPVSASGGFWIACVFTAISLVRSYILRRIFNRIRRLHAPHG